MSKLNPLYGAVIGDIAGSRFEFNNYRHKDFVIFHPESFFTDDTVMSIALAKALSQPGDRRKNAIYWMQKLGRDFPGRGYGGNFFWWLQDPSPEPYNSFGNGSAMRTSAAPLYANSLEEALEIAEQITDVTHNHPEGIKGAKAVSEAIWLALQKESKEKIAEAMKKYYDLSFTCDEIRPFYQFNETCQETVPQALKAFLESEDFEDAIRLAVSLGGDSDTLAAITGSVAAAYYGLEPDWIESARNYLDPALLEYLDETEKVLNQ